jgi:hypothetical protein
MKPDPWGEEAWKLCDFSLFCYHMFFSSDRYIMKFILINDRICNGSRIGYTFLAEMLQKLPRNNEYIIIADAGPVGTTKCAELLHDLGFKFLLCVSGSKQIPDFRSYVVDLSRGNILIFNLNL